MTSIQAAIMAVQHCMQQHSGSFLQFRCDEKGFVSICAFGLPGNAHEDDPCRGIRAALDLVTALQEGVHFASCHPMMWSEYCMHAYRQSQLATIAATSNGISHHPWCSAAEQALMSWNTQGNAGQGHNDMQNGRDLSLDLSVVILSEEDV